MKKVIVAMSGGIDSAVAVALLKKQSTSPEYFACGSAQAPRRVDVVGGFMRLVDLPNFRESEKRAKGIAKILGIPFFVLDLRKEFQKQVIDYFLKEYRAGRTPNPCVVCNKKIKFGLFLKEAKKRGADFIATGHYARRSPVGLRREIPNYKLLKAKDRYKDQSYFLWQLNQRQLKHILFPLGNYTKTEVKNLAKKFGFLKFVRQESQEICFIETTTDDFLRKYLKQKPGKIINNKGEIIGKHQSLAFYTIGQRKTIGLSGGPYYVLDKDKKKNSLIVTKNENDLYKKEVIAKNVNWISGRVPKLPLEVKAKIRYRHKPASSVILELSEVQLPNIKKYKIQNTKYDIQFDKSQRAITPGQSVVFYRGQELLGGGIIES